MKGQAAFGDGVYHSHREQTLTVGLVLPAAQTSFLDGIFPGDVETV